MLQLPPERDLFASLFTIFDLWSNIVSNENWDENLRILRILKVVNLRVLHSGEAKIDRKEIPNLEIIIFFHFIDHTSGTAALQSLRIWCLLAAELHFHGRIATDFHGLPMACIVIPIGLPCLNYPPEKDLFASLFTIFDLWSNIVGNEN